MGTSLASNPAMLKLLAVLLLSCSSLVLSMQGAPTRPYQFSYQVRDLQQGLQFAAEENSNGQLVSGKYQVLLPGNNNRNRNRHIKRNTRQQAGAHQEIYWR